jgi:hypothetical protein
MHSSSDQSNDEKQQQRLEIDDYEIDELNHSNNFMKSLNTNKINSNWTNKATSPSNHHHHTDV